VVAAPDTGAAPSEQSVDDAAEHRP
jgi:hypothetical protein